MLWFINTTVRFTDPFYSIMFKKHRNIVVHLISYQNSERFQ